MSLGSSSSVYPTASLAAILAIGKPVALDASADERDTRGIHLDHDTSVLSAGFDRELDVRPPCFHTDLSRMTGKRRVTHELGTLHPSESVWMRVPR